MEITTQHLPIRLLAFFLALFLTGSTVVSAAAVTEPPAQPKETAAQDWPKAPEIASASAVLLETTTGAVLYEKAADEPRYPASAVKIMTALLALENSAPDDVVTFTQTGVAAAQGGAANIAARDGEKLTVEQCLYGILLTSANDASAQLAEHISGSVEKFVKQMNKRAKKLGCTDTVFTNPTGLPDEKQHSTARDLALILEAALEISEFRTIAAAPEYTIPATNATGAPRILKNTFPMAEKGTAAYDGVIAGRSGYTQASLSTLAAAAEKNGTSLVCVLLSGPDGQTVKDAAALFDYGFGSFQRISYADASDVLSGGFAILPNNVSSGELVTKESADDRGVLEQYYYQNRLVGQTLFEGFPKEDEEQEASAKEAADRYLKQLHREKSMTPYLVIFAVWVVLLAILGWRMRRVLKNKR